MKIFFIILQLNTVLSVKMLKKILFIQLLLINSLFSNEIEDTFIKNNLIEISSIDNTINVDLVNSDENKNYFNENFYKGLNKCYLQKEIAYTLKKAQMILKNINKEYSLNMMDCTRPRSISQKMYDKLKNTPFKKYVANPKSGSMHNYGAAVDVSIIDKNGNQLDFGLNPFYVGKIKVLINFIKYKYIIDLSDEQLENRKMLKTIMSKAGFKPIELEWWHFNGFDKNTIRKKYKIID